MDTLPRQRRGDHDRNLHLDHNPDTLLDILIDPENRQAAAHSTSAWRTAPVLVNRS